MVPFVRFFINLIFQLNSKRTIKEVKGMNKYILYGTKNNSKYYVTNVNPVLWSPEIINAKTYQDLNSARFSVLRDWDNYDYVLTQINTGLLDMFFVAIIDENFVEKERVKLL